MMVANPQHHPAGDFCLREGRLHETGSELLTFSGIGLYHPAFFADVPIGAPAKLGPLLREAMTAGRISGTRHNGYWLDVGTPQRLAELDDHRKQSKP
jgi:MurNAc alpha-1-phosphate uridylyltransferase